jgi:hypothetical protein
LLAHLHTTLALFVATALFSNLRVVHAEDHVKAKADLEHIIALSNRLHEKSAVQVGTTN